MFKYRIIQETLEPELGYVSSFFFVSKDDKEIEEKLKTISDSTDLEKIKSQVVEAWRKHKEEIKNTGLPEDDILEIIYTPFIVRIPLFDPKNPPASLTAVRGELKIKESKSLIYEGS